MDKIKFYNKFHRSIETQTKLISENNYTYIKLIKILNELLSVLKNDNGRLSILNYGCGVGTIDLFYADKGYEITGVDISPKAIETARNSSKLLKLENKIKFITLDKFSKIKNKRFDLIICTEVLEHLDNDYKTLNLLVKMLKRDGRILISVPSSNAPLYRLGLLNAFDNEVGHIRRYTPSSISLLVNKSGLNIEKIMKEEGLLRNSFYTLKPLEIILKFMKWKVSSFFEYVDNKLIPIFGESDLIIIARKK